MFCLTRSYYRFQFALSARMLTKDRACQNSLQGGDFYKESGRISNKIALFGKRAIATVFYFRLRNFRRNHRCGLHSDF